jgi:asparagine synthase (glutamine-hydrolysing)
MCGICGFTGKPDRIILKKMTDVITHRGPDEDGMYMDEYVNLGMRRLSILDLEMGHQPIHNEDESLWLVFNGEIYNYLELQAELVQKGHKFYTDHSDSEVIIHAYEEYGEDCVHKFNGMFAIALWDKKNKKLLLIRDRMGVKPLFYTEIDSQIVFGSEIKTILNYPDYRKAPDYDALSHYFTFKNIPSPLTAFAGIKSLLPGEIISFQSGKTVKQKYWTLSFNENHEADVGYFTSNIFNILEDAVKIRMRCDVPFGAYLSGGLDSSAIVALMTRFSAKPIRTFSLGYVDSLANKETDLYYARKVSEMYKTDHHEYIMPYSELVDDISEVASAFDQPFSGTVSTFFLSKLIKKHVKVALSGDGADELFGSYLSHRIAQPMAQYGRLREKLQSGSLSLAESDLFKSADLNFLEELFQKSGGNAALWRYQIYMFTQTDKEKLFSSAFKYRLTGDTSLDIVKKMFANATSKDPLNCVLETEYNSQFPDQVLAFVDFLSMAHSVEVRSPFLDYRLAEFSATIPGSLKISNGNVKDILKKALAPILPDGIAKRPKEGFVLPIYDWLQSKQLKGACESLLSKSSLDKHGLLNVEEVNRITVEFFSGKKALAGKVWNLMMFQVWWERYFG